MASMLDGILVLALLEIYLLLHVAQSSPLAWRKDCFDQAWFDETGSGNGISLGQQRLTHQPTRFYVHAFILYSC